MYILAIGLVVRRFRKSVGQAKRAADASHATALDAFAILGTPYEICGERPAGRDSSVPSTR
jgi:hypothetical protein